MLAHRFVYLVIGSTLLCAQHGWIFQNAAQVGKPVDFLLVYLKQTTLYRLMKYCGAHSGALQQVLFAHLSDLPFLEPARHVQIGQQQGFLLGGALELIKVLMQFLLVVTGDG